MLLVNFSGDNIIINKFNRKCILLIKFTRWIIINS